ncbi:hypothetical protein [Ideonella sp. A 288]|uniref:hypothetical protein n=1 Tax=Ideonella sp. A 288 TaxID=1962181 RepID=UPI00118565DA|nr:hypothetical protein [Ideonella sp. A 288]
MSELREPSAPAAKCIHLPSEGSHGAIVCFPIELRDNSGIAHALEHIVCGQDAYAPPLRDLAVPGSGVWFNARTECDHIAFYFECEDPARYVSTLDAVLAQTLRGEFSDDTFRRECFDSSPLAALLEQRPLPRGAVFLEMWGSFFGTDRQARNALASRLCAGTSFAFDPGGDPLQVARLDDAAIRRFRDRHLIAENCLVMSWGSPEVARRTAELCSSQPRREPVTAGPTDPLEVTAAPPPVYSSGRVLHYSRRLGTMVDANALVMAQWLAPLTQEFAPVFNAFGEREGLSFLPSLSGPCWMSSDLHWIVAMSGIGDADPSQAQRLQMLCDTLLSKHAAQVFRASWLVEAAHRIHDQYTLDRTLLRRQAPLALLQFELASPGAALQDIERNVHLHIDELRQAGGVVRFLDSVLTTGHESRVVQSSQIDGNQARMSRWTELSQAASRQASQAPTSPADRPSLRRRDWLRPAARPSMEVAVLTCEFSVGHLLVNVSELAANSLEALPFLLGCFEKCAHGNSVLLRTGLFVQDSAGRCCAVVAIRLRDESPASPSVCDDLIREWTKWTDGDGWRATGYEQVATDQGARLRIDASSMAYSAAAPPSEAATLATGWAGPRQLSLLERLAVSDPTAIGIAAEAFEFLRSAPRFAFCMASGVDAKTIAHGFRARVSDGWPRRPVSDGLQPGRGLGRHRPWIAGEQNVFVANAAIDTRNIALMATVSLLVPVLDAHWTENAVRPLGLAYEAKVFLDPHLWVLSLMGYRVASFAAMKGLLTRMSLQSAMIDLTNDHIDALAQQARLRLRDHASLHDMLTYRLYGTATGMSRQLEDIERALEQMTPDQHRDAAHSCVLVWCTGGTFDASPVFDLTDE